MKYRACLIILFSFIFFNCSAMQADTLIIISFKGEKKTATITARKGDSLQVKLPMQSGTGYVWEIAAKPVICTRGETQYEKVKSKLPGAPLLELINFYITTNGKEDIRFIYHRPFEKNTLPAKSRVLHLVVK